MRDSWIKTNWYYYDQLAPTHSFFIPAGSSVIEIGSGTGDLLDLLKPARGLGIDISPAMVDIARRNYSYVEFRTDDAENLETNEKFDYVVLSDLIGFISDVQRSFENLHRVCHRSTRILIRHQHFLREPLLHLAERLGRTAHER